MKNFSQLFQGDQPGLRARETEHERELNELYAKIGRLSAQLSWLEKNLVSNLSRRERLAMLEKEQMNILQASLC